MSLPPLFQLTSASTVPFLWAVNCRKETPSTPTFWVSLTVFEPLGPLVPLPPQPGWTMASATMTARAQRLLRRPTSLFIMCASPSFIVTAPRAWGAGAAAAPGPVAPELYRGSQLSPDCHGRAGPRRDPYGV